MTDISTPTHPEPVSTILSYPTRGPWGDPGYSGNMSGYVLETLIKWRSQLGLPTNFVYDPMAGSGTTHQYCRSVGIGSICTDFHNTRGGYSAAELKVGSEIRSSNDFINNFDILNFESATHVKRLILKATEGKGADLIMFHPPYWNMISYNSDARDFSQGPYSLYLRRMQKALQWLGTLLSERGMIALLLGDLRRKGQSRTYFLTDDTTSESTIQYARLEKVVRFIKIQHMTQSKGEIDGLGLRMLHEYITVMQRPNRVASTTIPKGLVIE